MFTTAISELYSDLQKLGVRIDVIKGYDPTEKQLRDLRNGLMKLNSSLTNSANQY
jgi:hypothetical protein